MSPRRILVRPSCDATVRLGPGVVGSVGPGEILARKEEC